MLSLLITFLLAIHVVVSLLIILIVLMQRPKSEGLGAAFGGGMMESIAGVQATNVLANATRWLGGMFFVLTLMLSILYAKQSTQRSAIQAALLKQAAAATPAVSGTAALSGTSAPFGGADMKLGVPPAAAPANALLPAPTLATTPVPASSPISSGTISGQ